MHHSILAVLTLLAVLALAPPRADATSCKKVCGKTQTSCFAKAAKDFRTGKKACKGLAPADKRVCLATARHTRTAARAACVTAFKSCKSTCGKGGGGGGGGSGDGACTKSAFGNWLATVNGYRGLAGLPAVAEEPTWTAGELAHSTYVVKNNYITHPEDPSKPFYTTAGNDAGTNGNVAASTSVDVDDAWAIDIWISGPFHAIGILDPLLARSAFGIYHEQSAAASAIHTAATLDVLRGRGGSPGVITFPVLFPGNGSVMPLDRFQGNESPNPLATCGFAASQDAPTGAPIIAQFATPPTITATSLTRDGVAVDHCEIDGTKTLDGIAAQVLAARNAVVIMPKDVLKKGSRYDVAITNGGSSVSWSFTVNCQ